MIKPFLQHLHRGGAYAYYHVLPERRSWWFETRAPLAPPAECATNWYVGVHPTSAIPPCNAHGEVKPPRAVRAQKRYICAINCLFAEYDVKDYGSKAAIQEHINEAAFPAPSVLVDSGGGMHAYWLLRDTFALETDDQREAARIIQSMWVGVVGGDPGAKDITRVLRIPGSLNFKYDPPRPVAYLVCDLDKLYTLQALTAHLPAVVERQPRVAPPRRAGSIAAYNAQMQVGDLLQSFGYTWHGRRKMLSPYSSTGQAGVTIDTETNRAFVHHGSDPLCTGYWQRPFDVLKALQYGGDFARTLEAIREHE